VKPLLKLIQAMPVKGMAHITGGGITENVPRVLPEGLAAEIKKGGWNLPPLFSWLQAQGNITDDEMYRTFNCGIGMVVIVSAQNSAAAKKLLSAEGEQVWTIGHIRSQKAGEAATIIV